MLFSRAVSLFRFEKHNRKAMYQTMTVSVEIIKTDENTVTTYFFNNSEITD